MMIIRRAQIFKITALFLLYFQFASTFAGSEQALSISFGSDTFVHRWSKDGQNEFTPPEQPDLSAWRDMVTINVHPSVRDGEQLASLANTVLTRYKSSGKIIATDLIAKTGSQPAQHLAIAMLGSPQFLEAVFARFMLMDGHGVVIVYSHRVYGSKAGAEMSDWLKNNGSRSTNTLMTWTGSPTVDTLKRLPQSPQCLTCQ
jgi:hypothetical protein